MSGRRAKKRRRMVAMAVGGDLDALIWCKRRGMTGKNIRRTMHRVLDTESRRPAV